MISILVKTTGRFKFLDENYNLREYTDYREVPEHLTIKEVVCFLPDIPPPPHSVQDHEVIHMWEKEFERLMEITYASRN